MVEPEYAGDVNPQTAWKILSDDPTAVLVDVRSEPEWRFVGLPDLSKLSKKPVCVSWELHPDMRRNPSFGDELAASGVGPAQTVLFICRSGSRSRHAATAQTALGFRRCYNVAEGFEGPRNEQGHRGVRGGWKAAGLPWTQE